MNARSLQLGPAAALILCAQLGFAADAPVYGPIPDWVQPVVPPAAVAADEAPFKALLADQQIRLTPAGEELYTANVVRIQTSQGLQSLGTLQLSWQPSTDILTVHHVHVLRDGQVIDLLGGDTRFTLLRRENNLEYSALDGVLTAVLQPSDLRVGDTLDLAYTIQRNDPVLAGTAESAAGGWVQAPYQRVHLRALWPRSFSIKWRATDDIKPSQQQEGDYSVVNFGLDDVEPPVQAEGAPLRYAIMRSVQFSSFGTWGEVSTRLAPLYIRAARIGADTALRQEEQKIAGASKDPAARAAAALKLVEEQIRYVYLGMNQAALVPADAETTWSRRFGDCKAKTVLLMSLLHELGIESEPVVVNTTAGDLVNSLLPTVSAFDHVIVRAHIGGRSYWLDGTRIGDRNLDALQTPDFRWGLPLTQKGSDLVPIVAEPLAQPSSETSIDIDASAGIFAPAPIRIVSVGRGDTAILEKNRFAALTSDVLDRTMRKVWAKQYPFVDVDAVSAAFDPDAGTETVTMDGVAHMDWKNGWYETDGLGVGYVANFTRAKGANVTAPYAVAFPTYGITKEKIVLPKGQAFTLSGGNVTRTVAGMDVRREVGIDPLQNVFYGEASVRSIAAEFPAADAAEAQTVLRAMAKDTVYLRRPDAYVQTPADLEATLKREPASVDEYIERGNRLIDSRKYDQAIADFSKALELDPKSDIALADRGLAYAWQKKNVPASADFDAAEHMNPKNAVVWRGRGLQAALADDYPNAITALSRSLELAPGNAFALSWRIYAYEMTGKLSEAVADADAAVAMRPTVHNYALRADLFARQSQKDKAVPDAIQAATLPDGDPGDYLLSARVLSGFGQRPQAFQAYSAALKKDPKPATFLARARTRSEADLDGRLADVDEALRLSPGMTAALSAKAQFQYEAGRYHDAVLSSTAAMLVTTSSRVLAIRAAALEKSGEKAQSQADAQAARKLADGNASLLNGLCWDLAVYGVAFDEALSACDAALVLSPNTPNIHDSRGLVLLRLDRPKEALAEYNTALFTRLGSASSLFGRGLARVRTGDAAGAQTDLQAAEALDADVEARYARMGLSPAPAR